MLVFLNLENWEQSVFIHVIGNVVFFMELGSSQLGQQFYFSMMFKEVYKDGQDQVLTFLDSK